jgi:hypothetical protein
VENQNKEQDLWIARTIADQMGGLRKLKLMIGAHSFAYDRAALSFKFRAGRKANYCKVTLNGRDLYDIEIALLRGGVAQAPQSFTDVYNTELRETFERATGLYLTFSGGR